MVAQTTMERNTYESAALDYAQRGLRVFPLHGIGRDGCTCRSATCSKAGKHPRTPNGFKDATTDADQIRAWWQQWPDANIGIATGRESGLVVVDVDPRHGGTLEAIGGCPTTATVQTGGGGWHLYFAYPKDSDIPSSSNRIAQGIDVRADGGYIVAAPSQHMSGNTYVWEADMPLAPLPAQLAERMTSTKAVASKPAALQRIETAEDAHYWLAKALEQVSTDGQPRNTTGFWLACQLRDSGVSEEAAWESMVAYAGQV